MCTVNTLIKCALNGSLHKPTRGEKNCDLVTCSLNYIFDMDQAFFASYLQLLCNVGIIKYEHMISYSIQWIMMKAFNSFLFFNKVMYFRFILYTCLLHS